MVEAKLVPDANVMAAICSCRIIANAELETVKLTHPSGSNAEVFLFGAHVKSFRTAEDPSRDVIFLSNHSYLDGVNPIMGGIPIVFPNFGSAKGFPGHGFARITNWTLAGITKATDTAGATVATFTMAASDSTRKMWPVEFELEYEVKLFSNTLETALHVHNTFTSAIDFHALLHNYLWVDDIRKQGVNVTGLVGLEYFDKVAKLNKTESREILTFDAETDSVYSNAPPTLKVSIRGANAPGRLVTLEKSAFIGNGAHQTAQPSDAVIWNPWVERSKTFKDFGAEEYINMLAVEPGRVSEKQSLAAGQTHARLLVHENVWGVMATISVPFQGSAFANIVSYSDGIGYSRENATGTMYFYLSSTDTTTVDLKVNPNATVALSKAQGGEKACYMDAEDPTCWRLSLVGKVEAVKEEDRSYAERVLFSKHPQMKHWPKKHGFIPYVLAIEHLVFLDFYGSAKHIAVSDYYKVKL
ncbi:hypothetical protein JM18_009420 [Phytophthora kernoviae]|uniref:CREG-like beta-barrel domain-containing protein n=2 Tax=Phytophthora kernoviae TaxID=325452 RepID=A0A8T0LIB9_9STRA|nr:hypothetical protein G195_011004 [Phytophthora kernoviae 00238/432]KAG2503625.1 hypothetical protein JM16_009385 [Phytophthora kernoviae]KAG2506573.1 hypothetical protein JM18_009420 [Phytophthora kernoviae]